MKKICTLLPALGAMDGAVNHQKSPCMVIFGEVGTIPALSLSLSLSLSYILTLNS
jgi:hypothetical protein